ncbi:MAG: hypothetical protein AAF514_07895 [Verrucomicrobiota bacterium]
MFLRTLRLVSPATLFLLLSLPLLPADEAKEPAEKPTPPPARIIDFQYAIYDLRTEASDDLVAMARILLKETFANRLVYQDGTVPAAKDTAYVHFREVPAKDYEPPKPEYLKEKGFGLTVDLVNRLGASRRVLLIDLFAVEPADYGYLEKGNSLAASLADKMQGLVWDEETRELYSIDAWRAKRLAVKGGIAFRNTNVHGYKLESGYHRLTTIGMAKLGSPDFTIDEFPYAFWTSMNELLEGLTRNTEKRSPFKTKLAYTADDVKQLYALEQPASALPKISLLLTERQENDPRNAMLTVDFNGYPGEYYQDQQLYLLKKLFIHKDTLPLVWENRETLMKESVKARDELKKKKNLFRNGLSDKEQLLVKALVGQEYLWFLPTKWNDDDSLEGRVTGTPTDGIREHKAGDEVKAKFSDVFDYVHFRVSGKKEGDLTGRLIEKLQQEAVQNR